MLRSAVQLQSMVTQIEFAEKKISRAQSVQVRQGILDGGPDRSIVAGKDECEELHHAASAMTRLAHEIDLALVQGFHVTIQALGGTASE